MDAPSKLSASQFPGAKHRYDDFVVVHMQQTLSIHGTVWLRTLIASILEPNLINRATSCLGTDTSHGPMSRLFGLNVDIMELNQYGRRPINLVIAFADNQ